MSGRQGKSCHPECCLFQNPSGCLQHKPWGSIGLWKNSLANFQLMKFLWAPWRLQKHTVIYLAMFISASGSWPKRMPRRLCDWRLLSSSRPLTVIMVFWLWIVRWWVEVIFYSNYNRMAVEHSVCKTQLCRLCLSIPHVLQGWSHIFRWSNGRWRGWGDLAEFLHLVNDGARNWSTTLFLFINFSSSTITTGCATHQIAEIIWVGNVMDATVIPPNQHKRFNKYFFKYCYL